MDCRVIILAAALGGCAAPQPEPAPRQPPRELAGRTASAPQRCVQIESSESFRTSEDDPHTLLYGSGRTIWVNALGPSCGFGSDEVLVTQPLGSSHCRGDIIRSFDRFSRIPGPSCVLGDFVPFTR